MDLLNHIRRYGSNPSVAECGRYIQPGDAYGTPTCLACIVWDMRHQLEMAAWRRDMALRKR